MSTNAGCVAAGVPGRVRPCRLEWFGGTLVADRSHLGADTLADALIAAEVITRTILARQTGMSEEELTAELTAGGSFHAEVHQASGMMSVQLGVGVGDALVRLRARAFALGRPIGEVAADVVARRLRFDE